METSSPIIKVNGEIIDDNSEHNKISLPEEIVTDIISRLPVKSVFQSQCISKNFSSITKDCNFIGAHLRHSACLRPSIIVNKGFDIYLIRSYGLDSEITVEKVPLHKIIGLTNTQKKIELVGSCNGLVVVDVMGEFNDDCFLLNPVTHKCDHLLSPTRLPCRYYGSAVWGFGYCAESKVYKIVRIAYFAIELLVEVLTYGIDSVWRKVDFSITLDQMCHGKGITVNGVVYWKPNRGKHNHNKLLSFDLEKEEFEWIFCPVSAGQIMEFRGSLAVCVNSVTKEETFFFHNRDVGKNTLADEESFDLWVLKNKDHGIVNEKYWEKIYTNEIFPSEPLLYLNDHQLLMLNQKDIFGVLYCSLYDMECKEIKEIFEVPRYIRFEALNFVESIVPLSTLAVDSENNSIEDDQE